MGLQGNWYLLQCYKIRSFQDLISEHQKVRHLIPTSNLQKILLILIEPRACGVVYQKPCGLMCGSRKSSQLSGEHAWPPRLISLL